MVVTFYVVFTDVKGLADVVSTSVELGEDIGECDFKRL